VDSHQGQCSNKVPVGPRKTSICATPVESFFHWRVALLCRGSNTTSKDHVSNVNWQKVIDNFRSSYQSIAPFEILLIELIANSLDAGAEDISVDLDGDDVIRLVVTDDGRGMRSRREFEEYHDLGSLTKSRGGGIGWAGIGAKLYIDRCDEIYTETRSVSFTGASQWSFPRGQKAPKWRDVPARGLLRGNRGTAIEITITDRKEARRFSPSAITETILANYNYAMRPHGEAVIKVDNERVEPFVPSDEATKKQTIDVPLREGGRASGTIYILGEDAPPGFGLVSIVVHGKTIGEQYDFRQFARLKEPERVAGYIRCDQLIHVTTTSKDAFNRRTSIWKDFDKRVGKIFSTWLDREGELEKIKQDVELEKLAADLQEDINRVFSRPEIRELGLDLFLDFRRRLTPIAEPDGDERGSMVEGSQVTVGTFGGADVGSGVLTEGEDLGAAVTVDSKGREMVTLRQRRVHGGVRLTFAPFPDRHERAWVDPGLQAIVVNNAHQAFKCAYDLDSVYYYAIDVCFFVVTETIEDAVERDRALSKLFGAYSSVSE